MPQRQLTEEEWRLAVRLLNDVQHMLIVIHGFTIVEGGVPLDEADESTTVKLKTGDMRQSLELVQQLIGFDYRVDPMPPPVGAMLPKWLRLPPRPE